MARYDAILIPGGGLLPGGDLPPWTIARLDRALHLRSDELLVPLSAATTHRPVPLDSHGRPLYESLQSARYLAARGVASSKIAIEGASFDTIGNAWFSRALHAEPRGLRKLLVITSAFHLARTEAAFRWVYRLTPVRHEFELSFEATPDTGIPTEALAARRSREASRLAHLRTLIPRHTTVESFHHWLYSEHLGYSVEGLSAAPERVTGPALDTY
jgi:hypothetical protein